MRHDVPSVSFKMGCRKNCAMKFDCIYNDPETVVSFAAERCHACQYDWPGDPAKVQKFSHNEALRFYATEWDLPDGVPADFWTLLPQSLLEYDRCEHVRNMLKPPHAFDVMLACKKRTGVYDPQTKDYSIVATEKLAVARMTTRSTVEGTCVNVDCNRGSGGKRYVHRKKGGGKNRPLNKTSSLCHGCHKAKLAREKQTVTKRSPPATETPSKDSRSAPIYTENCAPCKREVQPSVSDSDSKHRKTARGLEGLESAASQYYRQQITNLRKKLSRRDKELQSLTDELD